MPSVFIIASPRSGTTWLSKALNSHPKIYCSEGRFFGEYADFILDEGNTDPRLRVTLDKYVKSILLHHNFGKDELPVIKAKLIKAFISVVVKEGLKSSRKKLFVDKITPYIDSSEIVFQSISEYFPKSKIIYLLRDGRDVLTSGVFHWFNKVPLGKIDSEEEQKRKKIFLEKENLKINRFFSDDEIKEWALTWSQPLRAISFSINKHNVLFISYEDMLTKQYDVLKKTFEFIATRKSDNVIKHCIATSSFEKMTGNRKLGEAKQNAHVRKGVSGDWKNYFTKHDGELFHHYAGDMLMKYGYVLNEFWYKSLPDEFTEINK